MVDARPRFLGDVQVGHIALGCSRWSAQSVAELAGLLEAAVDAGVTLVDTADVYGSLGRAERLLGEVLGRTPHLRDRLVIATKAGVKPGVPYDSSFAHLVEACDGSLERLGCGHIDLFQIHRPDVFTHPEEVAAALTHLVEQGKVRAVGVSNYTPEQVDALSSYLPIPLASTSPELSLVDLGALRDGTLDQAVRLRLMVLPWSPLGGGGIATGRDVSPALLEELDRLAAREGTDRTVIALGFLLALPGNVVPILGTTRAERLVEGVAATKSLHLDRSDVYSLLQAAEGKRLP